MHPAMLRQPTAGHIREPATETGDGRRAGKRECRHRPRCPDALAPGRSAARVVADHPGQGWSLLCNGVVLRVPETEAPTAIRGRQRTLSLLAAIVLICAFGLVLAVTHHTFAVS
jgi:hypothetical protein